MFARVSKAQRSSKKDRPQYRKQRSLFLEALEDRRTMAGDMVIQWNNNLIETIRRDSVDSATETKGPTFASRNGAIMHLAVYDAVNAITQTHASYVTSAKAPATASKEAAVATAAYETLAALYPRQQPQLLAWWNQSLATVPNGVAENAGVAIGRQVAHEILALRTGDHATNSSNYVVNPAPGHWSPDPLNPGQKALGAEWGKVKPFAIDDPNDVQVPPPPALNSAEYAAAFNEVKSLGEKNSKTRTADQEQIGVFWAYDRAGMGPPMHIYNQTAQVIAQQKRSSLVDNARLFAMVNLSMADAGIASWNSKYTYDFWRPITGIRRGAEDGNAATVGDPNWVPYGAPGSATIPNFTPPFPAYVSGHATFGAAAFRSIANFYGTDKISFTLTSDELPGVKRSYTSLSQASFENGISRVFLGIHWRFDYTMGEQQGYQIADYVTRHFFQPAPANRALIGVQNDGGGFVNYVFPVGKADVALRRSHSNNETEVVNQRTGQVLFRRDLNDLNAVRFLAAGNNAADFLSVDQAYGGRFEIRNGINYQGNAKNGDGFWFAGNDANDNVTLDGNDLSLPGIRATLNGVTYVGLAGHGGDDTFLVRGFQGGRRVDVRGAAGDDTYLIGAQNLTVSLEQNDGTDTLDFSYMWVGVNVDLALGNGQRQSVGNGVTMMIHGHMENLIGSQHADRLRGNWGDNFIAGRGGNDLILGREGNDALVGEAGNDVLSGGNGHDWISGGDGKDLLSGGAGYDTLNGDGDENILIGGSTNHDANDSSLLALLAEWTSPRTRAVRIANLTNGSGGRTRLNGSNFLSTTGRNPTVKNDGVDDNINSTTGGDWHISS